MNQNRKPNDIDGSARNEVQDAASSLSPNRSEENLPELLQSLRESEERYQRIVQSVSDYIYTVKVVDGHPAETRHGSACVAVTGYTSEDFAANPALWIEMVVPEDRPAVLAQAEEVFRGGDPHPVEHRIVRKDGCVRWVRNTPVPHRRPDGQLTSYDGVIQDITERKETEQRLRDSEIKVQHMQKLESLASLAGGIAHDFNNLLVAVLGNADLALRELASNAPVRELVEEIKRAALRAAGLTSQMLAYSGGGRFVSKDVDLNALVREAVDRLADSLSDRIKVEFTLDSRLPCIQGDADHLRQAVQELIENAAEEIDSQQGVIILATGAIDAMKGDLTSLYGADTLSTGRYVFVEVSDTGCGMDQATLSRLFDPFFTTKFTGRGLGLAAVLGIVRGHHGTIQVRSEPGKGANIRLLLPCTPPPAMSSQPSQETGGVSASSGRTTPGKQAVLIADDEMNVLRICRTVLEKSGYRVLTAADGQEAVDLFRRNTGQISVVVLDMVMPRLDGREAFQRIRSLDPRVPVILCSGYSQNDVTQGFGAGDLAGFLRKPFQMDELISTLRRAQQSPTKAASKPG
jgi:two-component system cell cycle sensor histidine kinase/response regulator CckA